MSVIAELLVPSTDFELGRILDVEGTSSIELESLVPTENATVPLFWVHNATRDSFVKAVRRHPAVNEAAEVDTFEDRVLFTLDWDAGQDRLFAGITAHEGQLLSAIGREDAWEFELRFPNHEALSEFAAHCEDVQVAVEMTRVYNPTDPEGGPWYGLTEPQREAIQLAVRRGYYDIPRGCTTQQLADDLGISDQAVTERLRRAINTLVRHTLIINDKDR